MTDQIIAHSGSATGYETVEVTTEVTTDSHSEYPILWKASLACFVIAVLTGCMYRLGMVGWLNLDLGLQNIRHAHSHLMFFGWAVPFPLYIFLDYIAGKNGHAAGTKWMKNSIAASLTFGVLAYPFFLIYGYRPVTIGPMLLPLSAIFSGFVMFGWYGCAWGYRKARPVLMGDFSLPWMDGAVILLLISSLGAWGVSLAQAVNPEGHLFMKGLTHFFLATFTEGWVVLAILAILIMKLPLKLTDINHGRWQFALGSIAIGAPLTFPYGISESLLSPMLLAIARFGGGLSAAGLLIVLYVIFSSGKWKSAIWVWPIIFLTLKAVMQGAASVLPSSFWLSDYFLRIFYLHLLLLGAFTLLILGWLHRQHSGPKLYFNAIVITVLAVLFSLLLPTGLWPAGWSGIWIFYGLAVVSPLPAAAVILYWVKLSQSRDITSFMGQQ